MLDVVSLSRLQFGLTIGFHFIFVPLTIGMALFVAIMETLYVRTNDPKYKDLAKFWGKLFTINFILGVVTGVTMEFQFGTNWSKYSEFMGDIFGSPLAIEALMAFFLESTFLGIWIFGWNKVSKKMHAFAAWMVALGTHLSAIWIIVANGFMQNPVGYVLRNGRAEMVDFWAVLGNPYAWHTYFHTILSCYAVAGFFVLGVGAYHLLRNQHVELMKISMRGALALSLVATLALGMTGHLNGQNVALRQPAKLAAMEAQWETESRVGMKLLVIPDEKNETNSVDAISAPIPGLLSWLSTGDANATIKGLKDFPQEDRPPVAPTFFSFRLMAGMGVYLILVVLAGYYLRFKGKLESSTGYLKLLIWTIPVPYVSILLGWMVAEIGRQPWTVYGLFRTVDSVSPVPAVEVLITLVVVAIIYSLLVVLDIYMLARTARKGPQVSGDAAPAAGD